jgi:hypothetical protein
LNQMLVLNEEFLLGKPGFDLPHSQGIAVFAACDMCTHNDRSPPPHTACSTRSTTVTI